MFKSLDRNNKCWHFEEPTTAEFTPWFRRHQGPVFTTALELLEGIEYFLSLKQFNPDKKGGWIPTLASCAADSKRLVFYSVLASQKILRRNFPPIVQGNVWSNRVENLIQNFYSSLGNLFGTKRFGGIRQRSFCFVSNMQQISSNR